MSVVTVRKLAAETHRALKLRAAQHGRSTEAEIREILDAAVRPQSRLKIGTQLAEFGAQIGPVEVEFKRDPAEVDAAKFE